MNNTAKELLDTLNMARRVLAILEKQAAGYTALTIPARLVLELEEKRKEVVRLEAQVQAAATGASGTGLPHNLPRRGEFVGREAYKARVHEALRSRSYLVSIEGIGGIGKTSLALEVAYECLQAGAGTPLRPDVACFDGVIWASARARDLTLDNVLDAVARTLDYPGIAQKPLGEKREGVVRLLRSGAYLLLVDNFETITDTTVAEFLQDLPEPSKALVTTRERKLERAWTIQLKGLAETEALALIRVEGRRIGMQALEQAEDVVLLPLYQATGGAPLALKWAVGQIKQPGQSLDTVLAALHEARGNIFDHIFARSWEMLTPGARQVLMVMPLFATSASREAIKMISNIQHFTLDGALGQLLEMSLVNGTNELDADLRRYSLHPLVRAFSRAQLAGDSGREVLAWSAMVDFYQDFSKKCGGFWSSERYSLIEPELPNILAVVEWCWANGPTRTGMDIFYKVSDFMVIRGHWNEVIVLAQKALSLARKCEDVWNVARFETWPIGWMHRHRGNLDMAERCVQKALDVMERLGDATGVAFAKRNLGRIYHERGDLNAAERLLRETLTFYRARYDNLVNGSYDPFYNTSLSDPRNVFFVTANLASLLLDMGNLDEAWSLCTSILADARYRGDLERVSNIVSVMGNVAWRRGELKQAKEYCSEALSLMQQVQRPDGIADSLYVLARIELELGEIDLAWDKFMQALEYYRRLAIPAKAEKVESLLAQLDQEHPSLTCALIPPHHRS